MIHLYEAYLLEEWKGEFLRDVKRRNNKYGIASKKIEPVFLKDDIEKQIKILQYGKYGEECIAFELKNSGMDMYILHDIYIEEGDLSAQIDYLIVGRKLIYVLECKNLIGNIEVDSNGNFIRTYEINGKKIKEGIYSPITQNQRHLQVIKEKGLAKRTNILAKTWFEKNFDKYYKSIVVLSNPKTVLNAL